MVALVKADDGILLIHAAGPQLALLDDEGTETATATLELTQGSVTDVTEGEDGAWLVTLLTDVDTLSLSFVRTDAGALTCALDLDEAA